MSTYRCHACEVYCYDTPEGYVTGCIHHPHDCSCKDRLIGQCTLCVARERIKAGESIASVYEDYKWI